MHGGGTSLVAGMLVAMGVQMNYNPKAQVKWYKNYEDADFVRLNEQILKAAGGNWRKPPQPHLVARLADKAYIQSSIKKLVAQRQSKLWGFKDPRTALTIGLIHPHLINPRYIRVTRDHQAVARSMLSRGPPTRTHGGWVTLSKEYNRRIGRFLKANGVKVLEVSFENLVRDRAAAVQEATRMARFSSVKGVQKAVDVIQFEKVLR
jgi:hypothetical protein